MSISNVYNNNNYIKIWNVNNWECILNFKADNYHDNLNTACFLNKKNKTYFIINGFKDYIHHSLGFMKIYDLNGQKIGIIYNSFERTFFIDTYYDNILSKYYVITGNSGFSISYNLNNNEKYHTYPINNCILGCRKVYSLIIKNNNGIIKLISSSNDGIISIFNFHSGLLLNEIPIINQALYGMCLWNDNYLFVGCQDRTIKIVDIKKGKLVKSLIGHFYEVLTINKIIHSKYGECLISQNSGNSEIKLWTIKI